MPPILTNLFGLLLFALFAVLPAWYTNRYLLKVVRPKESLWRFVAYLIILAAVAVVYTTVVVWLLLRTIFAE
ncbi:hypothetical protein [Paraflavitalea sp. CAU 1676]|uniref:hypothetical protein n=1 Tax=Paraflavitalea sp. CAU 1676 TaxID=3032598 RepID=UPI0023D9C752|nr:hypothetical protein [Paraflavitalea sp. CAU 1676]MDF2187545.1 hypothetical protein [Paraflavitalea sp. CAU 1676]